MRTPRKSLLRRLLRKRDPAGAEGGSPNETVSTDRSVEDSLGEVGDAQVETRQQAKVSSSRPTQKHAASEIDPVQVPIEDALDLHSFRPDQVGAVVEEYLREAHAAGFAEVRIIHGRGIGTQREIVRAVLAESPLVISFADARPERGGWGATVVALRVAPRVS